MCEADKAPSFVSYRLFDFPRCLVEYELRVTLYYLWLIDGVGSAFLLLETHSIVRQESISLFVSLYYIFLQFL